MEAQEILEQPKENKKVYEYSIVAELIFILIGVACILGLLSPLTYGTSNMTRQDWFVFSFAPIWLVLTIAVKQKKAWAAIYFFIFVIYDMGCVYYFSDYDTNMGVLYGICMFVALLIPHKRKIGWQILFHKQDKSKETTKPYSNFVICGLIILAFLIGLDVALGYIQAFKTNFFLGLAGIIFWSLVLLQLYLIYKKEAASYVYFIILSATYLTVPFIIGESINIPSLCIISFFIVYLTILLLIPIKGQSGWKLLWGKDQDVTPAKQKE
jgi:hypothetical protein